MVDLLVSVLDSPYANYLIRQFVLTAMTKMCGRTTTSPTQQQRIAQLLDSYATSPELEIQQRAIEFENLLTLGEIKYGVLERMPPPEIKATVMGVGMSHGCPSAFLQHADHNCSCREQTCWLNCFKGGKIIESSSIAID